MNHHQRDLLQRVHDAGIVLKIEGDQLRYTCPPGAMTPGLRAELAAWKPDLILEYQERCGILQYDARLPRPEAEAQAAATMLERSAPEPVEEPEPVATAEDTATPEPFHAREPLDEPREDGDENAENFLYP